MRSGPVAPESLDAVAARIEARIDALLTVERARWASLDIDLAEPLDRLATLVLAGGKRLRPAFCHWAFVGAGGDPDDPLVTDAGAALELLHSFALIHDDIMDASERRRGMETVHRAYEARHRRAGWGGEGRRFGEGMGILLGDLAFVYADLLLTGAPRPALELFTELRLEVSLGQYLDLLGTARGGATPELSRRISLYKSGKYTVERPLHLGAALAGRLEDLTQPLSAYGVPMGEAFQLRDDLLGAFGDTGVTGKPVGQDLWAGKPTALFALARARARGPAAEILAECLGAPCLTPGEAADVQAVLESTGARRAVEGAIDALVAQALDALERAPITDGARCQLAQLAHFVACRDS